MIISSSSDGLLKVASKCIQSTTYTKPEYLLRTDTNPECLQQPYNMLRTDTKPPDSVKHISEKINPDTKLHQITPLSVLP